MQERTQLSATKLKTFQTCPAMYKAQYIDRVKAPVVGNALILGSAVHGTLEASKKALERDEKPIDLAKYFHAEYDKLKAENERKGKIVEYGDWDSYEGDISRGTEIVTRYPRRSTFHNARKIYTEVPFIADIPGVEDAYLFGYIDGVVKDENDFFSIEYKTTKEGPTDWWLQNDIQMTAYAFALKYGVPVKSVFDQSFNQDLEHLFGQLPEKCYYIGLHSLCSTKKPWQVQELEQFTEPKEEWFPNFAKNVKETWEMIKFCTANNYWPQYLKSPTDSPCKRCQYRFSCWGISQPQGVAPTPAMTPAPSNEIDIISLVLGE